MSTMKLVTGLTGNYGAAQTAIQRIMDCGHAGQDINMITTDDTPRRFAIDESLLIAAALVIGGVVGALVGGVGVPLVALVANALFAAELVEVAPLVAAGVGLGSGSVAGGMIGALFAWGVPEQLARAGTKGLKKGGFLIGVRAHSEDDAKMIRNILTDVGATLISSEKAGPRPASS